MVMRTQKIQKEKYKIYLNKAEEFFELMKDAESKGLWNGVGLNGGLNGVHCAISACDALTTFYLGERSRGQKHEDVAVLLKRIDVPQISEKINQISAILSIKSLVEYEARGFGRRDGLRVAKQTDRLFNWIKSVLPR